MSDASMSGNSYFRLEPVDPLRGSFEDQDTYQGQPLQALLGRASLISTAHDPKSGFQLGFMPSSSTFAVLSNVRTDHDRGTAFSVVQSKEQSSNDQSSTASNHVSDDLPSGFCAICADKATGNHYGVISCNGCKGFFRRTCWKKQRYICRFTDNCIIDKDHRNACRFCRFQKCLNAGMKREAIQNERDSIGCSSKKKCGAKSKRKRSQPNPDDTDDDSDVGHEETIESPSSASDSGRKRWKNDQLLDALLEMEARCNLYRHSMVTMSSTRQNMQSIAEAVESPSDFARAASNFYRGLKKASIDDLQDSWRTTLLLLVEWAKGLKPFPDLPTEDKLNLLRNYAAQHLLLLPAYKSPDDNVICLVNDCYVPRDTDLPDINNVVNRCLDELVAPMRRMEMTDAEFVLMKTLVFMNPDIKGLRGDSRPLVRLTREQAIQSLYDYEHKQFTAVAPKRFGTLLLLAPQLKEIAQLLVENIQLVKLFGLATTDQLLEELLLDDSDRSDKKNAAGGSAGSFEVNNSFIENGTNSSN